MSKFWSAPCIFQRVLVHGCGRGSPFVPKVLVLKRQFLLRGHSALEFVVPLAMFKRCVQSFCEPAQPPGEVCGYEEAG